MMLRLWGFLFDSLLGKGIAAITGLAALISWYTIEQRSIGADRARAEIEEKARDNVARADKVRRLKRSDAGGRVRDPYADR